MLSRYLRLQEFVNFPSERKEKKVEEQEMLIASTASFIGAIGVLAVDFRHFSAISVSKIQSQPCSIGNPVLNCPFSGDTCSSRFPSFGERISAAPV